MVLPSLERPQKEPGCWLQEARTDLDPKARIGVILGWRQCVALHGLEIQMMRTSRGLIGAPDI